MLGYLYSAQGNVSPSGQPFDGLTGTESCPDGKGGTVNVYQITPSTPNAYFMPGADPGWSVLPGTTASEIMGCYTPAVLPVLPVLSALAAGYAVCDHWFASVPTETMPNRAFTCAGTSMGQVDDNTKTFSAPSIFHALGAAGQSWVIYGYNERPLSADTFTDVATAVGGAIGLFTDFQAAAAAGTLPAFSFLEPSWPSTGNSQHPNYNVALGEQLIHDVYEALRSGPGWAQTLARDAAAPAFGSVLTLATPAPTTSSPG